MDRCYLVFFLAGEFDVAEGVIAAQRVTTQGGIETKELWFEEVNAPANRMPRHGWFDRGDIFKLQAEATTRAAQATEAYKQRHPKGGVGGRLTLTTGSSSS